MKQKTKLYTVFALAWLLLLGSCTGDNQLPKGGQAPVDSKVTAAKPAVEVPNFDEQNALEFIKKQLDFGTRDPGSKGHKACAEWLGTSLQQWADTVYVQKATLTIPSGKKVPMYNFIASFRPEAKQRVILAAHWDTRENADQDKARQQEPIAGANDGGSGVGVLLEIAQILKRNPLKNMGVDIILFDTEDQGIYGDGTTFCLGSQYWANNLHLKGYTASYGILLDMVGAADAVFLKEQNSLRYAPTVVQKIWNTAANLGYGSYFRDSVGGAIDDDHLYVNTIAKIPMADIIHYTQEQGFGSFWHTHSDDLPVISSATLKAVGHTVLAVVYAEDAATRPVAQP